MISKKILAIQVGILACGLTLAPCGAAPTTAKTKITKLKLSLNDAGDSKSERGDADRPPRLSEAELLRIAEMKSKFADSMAPKLTELNSLHRQMKLAMAKPTVDRAQVMQLQSRINSVHAELANSRLTFELDMSEGMPADAKEHMRKHLLFDAAFGPDGGFGGPPPPGFGPPPTCVPPPGFGPHHPPFGPPPMMGFPSGLRPEGMTSPMPGRGPGGVSTLAPLAPPSAHSESEPDDDELLMT